MLSNRNDRHTKSYIWIYYVSWYGLFLLHSCASGGGEKTREAHTITLGEKKTKMIDWFWKLIDKCVERSLQKQSNKLFEKSNEDMEESS